MKKENRDFTTNEMNHLFNRAWTAGKSYAEFMEMIIEAAGYEDGVTAQGNERAADELAKNRFHRWRHDLKGKGVEIPTLVGAPSHRITGAQMISQFEWAKRLPTPPKKKDDDS